MKIKCKKCDGHYILRESQYGLFGECSEYPNCKSTINLSNLIFEFFINQGINIYRWEKECYRCHKKNQGL